MLSLNELAQFINVLKGDMSIVGPRPEVPVYARYWPAGMKEKILSIKPGITGYATVTYWQESNILNDKDNPEGFYVKHIVPEKLRLESWYVDNWNLLWDVKLMVQTFLKAFSGERKGHG
ncbi:MAG TPA: sugar transferase [Desulfosporosinus sp.]|nr:sugar transferase [Desulfatiglandales bacterium]HUX47146.1 sugar transferase [Desulfosporosinus sp.]